LAFGFGATTGAGFNTLVALLLEIQKNIPREQQEPAG
jgi:hypothetical protein